MNVDLGPNEKLGLSFSNKHASALEGKFMLFFNRMGNLL